MQFFKILLAIFPQIMPYFDSCWHNIKESWVGCFIRQYVTFGNLTNNFVESHHQKIKKHVGAHTSIPDLVEDLVMLSETRHLKAGITKSKLSLKKRLIASTTGSMGHIVEKI